MPVIAYYRSNEDPAIVQNALLAMDPRPRRVSMRAGWAWKESDRTEDGFRCVHAPGFPGILRAYAAAGVPALDGCQLPQLSHPRELTELPVVEEVSILSAGVHLRQEIAALPPSGLAIAINEACVAYDADWFLANDGFSALTVAPRNDPIRVCRRVHAASIPGGPWYALDRIGITDGTYSVLCALRLAAAMGASRVWLYGNDLVKGKGVDGLTCSWSQAQVNGCRRQTEAMIADLAVQGVTVRWVRVEDGLVTVDHGLVTVDHRPLPLE